MFAAAARRSGEGPECLIGVAVGNEPVLRTGAGELRYCTTVRMQELLGLIQPRKRLQTIADKLVLIVTKTAMDGALHALSR